MDCKTFTSKHFPGHIDSDGVISGFNAGDWPIKQPDSHRLDIYYQDSSLINDSPISSSITKWGGRAAGHYYRGTFLAHGWKSVGEEKDDFLESGRPCELDSADLSYLLGHYQIQGKRHRMIYRDFKEFK